MSITSLAMGSVAWLLQYEFWRERLSGMIHKAFFSPPDLTKLKKVLCVQPHPDDNEIGMGGSVRWMTQHGIQVDYLTVTDGGLGAHDKNLCGDALIAARRQETQVAGALLGVTNFHFFDLADGSLEEILPLTFRICELLRQEQYDGVFCPDPYLPYEVHRDHIVVGQAVAQACISTELLEYPRGTKTAPYAMQAIGFYFTKKPNTILDTTPHFKTRFQAIAAHKSQISPEMLEMYRMYFTLQGTKLGEQKGYKLAEGLKVLAPLHLHCITEAEEV